MYKIFGFVMDAFAAVKNLFKRDKVERWSTPSGIQKGVPRESQYRSENHSLFFAPFPNQRKRRKMIRRMGKRVSA